MYRTCTRKRLYLARASNNELNYMRFSYLNLDFIWLGGRRNKGCCLVELTFNDILSFTVLFSVTKYVE